MGQWEVLAAIGAIAGMAMAGEAPAQGMRQVVTGYSSACELTAAGAVRCWGANSSGQLGDGTTTPHNAPLPVAGLDSGVQAIAMGLNRACAITSGGGLKCWGDNFFGGVGGTDKSALVKVPEDVVGLSSGVAAVSVGLDHTCALTTAGIMKCWGANLHGQIGDATATNRAVPVDVMSGVAAISAGSYHTCALTGSGALECWGADGNGQLGDGQTSDFTAPRVVPGLASGVTSFSAGDDQTCAVQGGNLFCWGANQYTLVNLPGGAIDADAVIATQPTRVTGFDGPVASVSVGWAHTCAVTATAGVKCWRIDWYDELGSTPYLTYQSSPSDVAGLAGPVASVSAGATFTCALLVSGLPQCWGYNTSGEVGNATNDLAQSPAFVADPQPSYQGLWWNSPAGSESGWGINLTLQGDVLFATWFTYDTDGSPLWLIMSNGEKSAPGMYHGALYRTTGPAYDAPFSSASVGVTQVGDATFAFSDPDNGTFRYTVNGVTQTKNITREIFGVTLPRCLMGGPTDAASPQDLWWNSPAGSESGWGLQLAEQDYVIFGAWFTYDHDGSGLWIVMPRLVPDPGSTTVYSGSLYRTTGPAFSASPWNPLAVAPTAIGTVKITFLAPNKLQMDVTSNGKSFAKTLERERYRSPATSCFF